MLGHARLGLAGRGKAGNNRKAGAMGQRAPFEPLGDKARWRTVYEILATTPTGDVITYETLGEALGLHPVNERPKIVQAFRRAARQHETEDNRAVEAVPGLGYRPVDPSGSLELARGQQKRAGRSLARGHSKAVHVDLNGVDPQVRAALETIGKAFVLQMDFNRRFEVKQQRLEQTVREIADSQAQERKRTDEELDELRARLARLEGTTDA